jgi:hypothetical protein
MWSLFDSKMTSWTRGFKVKPMMLGSCMSSRKVAPAGAGNAIAVVMLR